MTTTLDRRDILGAALGGAVGLSLPLAACGRVERPESFAVTRLGEDMILIAGAGGNVVASRARDGVVMVDGGLAEWADPLARVIAEELGTRQIQALFNTHWHREQTGSNERLGKAGVKIIAHENTKQWLGAEVNVRWEHKVYPPLPDEALPNDTCYDSGELAHGDQTLEYAYLLQAHTDGDIYVRFPAENLIAVGDALTGEGWPIIDWWTGGWMGGVLDGFETLLAVADADTRIVPARGPVLTRADLESQYEMYNTIMDRLVTMLKSSYSPAEAVAARPTEGFMPEWGDPDLFVELAFRSFYGHLRGDRRLGTMP